MAPQKMTPRLVGDLTKTARQIVRRTHGADSCIHSVSVLRRLIELATPTSQDFVMEVLPVCMIALNPSLNQWFQRMGRMPMNSTEVKAARDAGCWAVAITPIPGRDYEASSDRFPGHLVLGLDFSATGQGFWLADPSVDQASRPDRALCLEPMVVPLPLQPGCTMADWCWSSHEANGGLLIYERAEIEPERWESTPDWIWGQQRTRQLELILRQF